MCLMLLLPTIMVFLEKCMSCIHSTELTYLEQNHPLSTLISMFCLKHSSQKLPQFTQENNMLDAAIPANMIFFTEVYVFPHHSWIGLFGSKRAYIHFETSKLQAVLWPKLPPFSQENNGYLLLHLTEALVYSRHVFLQHSWIGLLGEKGAFIHHENSVWQEVFLSNTTSIFTGKQLGRCSSF
jgi:hypothetical protein